MGRAYDAEPLQDELETDGEGTSRCSNEFEAGVHNFTLLMITIMMDLRKQGI